MYYLRYVFIPLYLVVLNIYEQSDFLRSELKSIKIMSKIPEKKFTFSGIYGPIIYLPRTEFS